jgi:hypothetical protein
LSPVAPILAQARRFGLRRALAYCAMTLITSAPAWAQSDQHGNIAFDIPAQALAAALESYGDISGREVLYDTSLTVGRRSGAVKGTLTPEAALQSLLGGTGLGARFLGDGSFILVAPPPSHTASPAMSALVPQQHYYGRVQAFLRSALCATDDARPGAYRAALLLWIGATGNVARYARLSSTGSADIDRGVDRTLAHLSIGEAPPTGFDQPVLVMIMPQAPGVTMGCTEVPMRASRASGP